MNLSPEAKAARYAYKKQWEAKNRDKVNGYQRKWRSKNPEKVQEYNARYWERKADAGFQQLREALGGGSNGC